MVRLAEERRLALFPDGTIVRDPHHREKAGFKPAQNISIGTSVFSHLYKRSNYINDLHLLNSSLIIIPHLAL